MSDHRPAAELAAVVMARLQKGYHDEGHHPYCAAGEDDGCDCYARQSAPARAALATLVARTAAIDGQDGGYAWVCDLCGQLLAEGEECNSGYHVWPDGGMKGKAIRSDALAARVEHLEQALRPFAEIKTPPAMGYQGIVCELSRESIQRARAALVDGREDQ